MITDADYKQMYLIMFRASEEAISLLIQAQRECEELYLSASELLGYFSSPDLSFSNCRSGLHMG